MCIQCLNNHYAKLEYDGMNTVGVTDYQTRHTLSISDGKNVISSTPVKNEKIFIKGAQNSRCTSSMLTIII